MPRTNTSAPVTIDTLFTFVPSSAPEALIDQLLADDEFIDAMQTIAETRLEQDTTGLDVKALTSAIDSIDDSGLLLLAIFKTGFLFGERLGHRSAKAEMDGDE